MLRSLVRASSRRVRGAVSPMATVSVGAISNSNSILNSNSNSDGVVLGGPSHNSSRLGRRHVSTLLSPSILHRSPSTRHIRHDHPLHHHPLHLYLHPLHHPHYLEQRRSKVFVSRHNTSLKVSPSVILDVCQTHSLHGAKQTASHVILKECPFCPKPTNDKLSNLFKLYVAHQTGAYFCHRCGAKGSWYDFKAQLNGGYGGTSTTMSGASGNGASSFGSSSGSSSGGSSSSSSSGGTRSYGGTGHQGDGSGGGGGGAAPYLATQARGQQPSSHFVSAAATPEPALPLPNARLSAVYSSMLLDPQGHGANHTSTATTTTTTTTALEYLTTVRGLDRKTLRKYGVGRATYKFAGDRGYEEAECVTFPWILRESELISQEEFRGATVQRTTTSMKEHRGANEKGTSKDPPIDTSSALTSTTPQEGTEDAIDDPFVTRRIKVRAVQQKAWQRLDPAGGGWGLFGWHTIPEDATELIVTEGEYDAMAVSQATGRPAVSLPNGCRSLPVQVLPLLEKFEKIYLWMDNDLPGQEGAQKFAKKLGLNRSYIVHCRDAKDANDALLKGLDMSALLDQAAVVPHDRILTFADLREEVLHELLQPDLYTGVPIPSLPQFTDLIKGFRRGEMTVLTGPTGSGKTTFLGQISLDLAEQGINVLWGSFEIKNTRLLHKLLKQFSRDALPDITQYDAKEALDALADRFEHLPLHFMRFHGGSEVDEVLDAMEYAVYVNDTEHIILDNMQFMITRNKGKSGSSSTFDKFDVQDVAIEKFRRFATEHNVHVTLVVHPRKEDESSKLNMSSFYGSAKATQEADTVLILQNDGRRKYLEVKKNRFDGALGHVPLYFQSKSGRYSDTEGGPGSTTMSGGRNGSPTGGGAPLPPGAPIAFAPPRKQWSPPREEEPEPEGLDDHWNICLAPRA